MLPIPTLFKFSPELEIFHVFHLLVEYLNFLENIVKETNTHWLG